MSDGSEWPGVPRFDVIGFAKTLSDWLTDYDSLLGGVVALRRLGVEADDAVRAVLTVPVLRRMRLGWELWEALVEGEGEDPEILLGERLPLDTLETARRALWGDVWPRDPA